MVGEVDRQQVLGELSESQRACLLLVRDGFTSKEIARRTGLTPQTVDQYMSKAAATLGVSSRRDAARILTEAFEPPFSTSELRTPTVADAANIAPPDGSPESDKLFVQSVDGTEKFTRTLSAIGQVKELISLPPVGGKRHELGWIGKATIVVRIAVVAIVLVASLIALTRGAIYLLTT